MEFMKCIQIKGRSLMLLSLLLVSCTPALERGSWTSETYDALSALLQDKSNRGGYAVFDCDNTSIVHDITHNLTIYMVENLRFADAPEHSFLDGLPDGDAYLERFGMSVRAAGDSLRDEYRSLKALDMPIDSLWQTDLYKDWRARFLAFYEALGDVYDYDTLCIWEPSLLSGYSDQEKQDLGRESTLYWLSQGRSWEEEWVSPDGRFRGVCEKGLIVTDDMKALYKALPEAGITPYVCSASAEWLVELLVCDREIGFGLDPDRVFGVRLDEPDYVQPFREGKVACIDRFIAPLYDGKQPVLVAGDSNGDVAMLTAYPEMKVGLILDLDRGGAIDSLADRRDGRYYAQPVVKMI